VILLLRHAEPEEDLRGRCYGSLDVGLSPPGRRQARDLAAELAEFPCDAVVASPRVRAVDTASPLAVARGLEVVVDERLRELDFGSFEGRTYEEIAEAEPELFRAWMEAPTTVRFPGGEGYDDLRTRAVPALEQIRRTHAAAIVVTHGGVIRAALAAWLELPSRAIFRLDQSYCGATLVEWIDDVPVVRFVNRPIR
jgi:alpha-ribazole phosphatase/probable phosphoglycerate mutase